MRVSSGKLLQIDVPSRAPSCPTLSRTYWQVKTWSKRRPWVMAGELSRRLEPGLRLSANLSGEELVSAIQRAPATEYLVVPAPSLWWLDHYQGFQRHLDRYRRTSQDPATAVIYELEQPVRASAGLS